MWPLSLVLGLGLISSKCFATQLIEPNDLDEEHLRDARKRKNINNIWVVLQGSYLMHSKSIKSITYSWILAVYASCLNTDNGAQDNNDIRDDRNATCMNYKDITKCGVYDNENFKAREMCCVCGGGKRMRYPGNQFLVWLEFLKISLN